MLGDILKKLNLTDKEALIYQTLLVLGPSNAARIGKEITLPRQTIYSIIQNLVGQGIVEQSDRSGVKHFFVEPNNLLNLIEKRKKDLEKTGSELEKELPKIIALQKHRKSVPKIQYYEGASGLQKLFENIIEQYKKGAEKVFRGYGVNHLGKTDIDDFLRTFMEKRHGQGVITKLFIGKGDDDFGITSEENRYGRNVKQLDIEPQESGIYVVGDRVYLFSFEDNVGIMVENEPIVKMLKAVFDERWDAK